MKFSKIMLLALSMLGAAAMITLTGCKKGTASKPSASSTTASNKSGRKAKKVKKAATPRKSKGGHAKKGGKKAHKCKGKDCKKDAAAMGASVVEETASAAPSSTPAASTSTSGWGL